MSNNNPHNQPPAYTFQGNSPTEELLEIARIHHKEARELLEHAQQARAEERAEEAKLLMDLAVAREERAMEFERAARGEAGDPIVNEILDWQEDLCETYTPHTLEFFSEEELSPPELPEGESSPPSGKADRAVAWISRKRQQCTRRILMAIYSFLQYIDGSGDNRKKNAGGRRQG